MDLWIWFTLTAVVGFLGGIFFSRSAVLLARGAEAEAHKAKDFYKAEYWKISGEFDKLRLAIAKKAKLKK